MASNNLLDFEKQLSQLDDDLTRLRAISRDPGNRENTPDLKRQISEIERRHKHLLEQRFAHLSPWDQVLLARHERRPYTLDYIALVFEEFRQLHGDRLFGDDGAIVAGLAYLDAGDAPRTWTNGSAASSVASGRIPVAVVGHQKGRDIKQRQLRNFGYAKPEGYRKAMRVMHLAERFGLPIVTLVDTPGASADVSSDERGISEAIARSMYEMSQLRVPIVSVIIGEGGSGGALGLAVADRVLMLEHSIYSVIAPEGCAAILWRDAERKAEAAEALNLTARRARDLGIADDVVSEPLGGAHRDPAAAAQALKEALLKQLLPLRSVPSAELVEARYNRFRRIGRYTEPAAAG